MNRDIRFRLSRLALCAIAITALSVGTFGQHKPAKHRAKKPGHRVMAAEAVRGRVRAVLAPTDFPIAFTAFDRVNSASGTPSTLLEISRNGFKDQRAETLFTKTLDGEQINSVVSWQNAERTHFGFLVLTTPSEGNLYSILFFLYHDGKLTMPINDVATGYPVFPAIRRTTTGQIQISVNDGSDATNDKTKTLVLYTWSDYSRHFLKSMHQVAAESVERKKAKIEKTKAASDEGQ